MGHVLKHLSYQEPHSRVAVFYEKYSTVLIRLAIVCYYIFDSFELEFGLVEDKEDHKVKLMVPRVRKNLILLHTCNIVLKALVMF